VTEQREDVVNLDDFSRDDWILGGVALLLVIDLLFLPWFTISVGPFSASTTATGDPDGWLGVLAVLAAVALARTSAVGTGSRVPAGLLPRLIIVFGALSATVLVAQVLREATIPGTSASATGRDIFPLIWSATMTLAVPLAAVVVRPRAFGIALLAGGLINDAGNAFFYSTPSNSAFAIPVAVLIGLTVTLGVTSRRRDMAAPDPPARAA